MTSPIKMKSGTEVRTKLSTVFHPTYPRGARAGTPPYRSSTMTPVRPRPNAIHTPERSRTSRSPTTRRSVTSQLTAASELRGAGRGHGLGVGTREYEAEVRQQLDHEQRGADCHHDLGNPE